MEESFKTIEQDEQEFIDKELTELGEELHFAIWIEKTKHKVQERLLIITKYRIITIKKSVTGKKTIQRDGHLFDLKEIEFTDLGTLVLKFADFYIEVISEKIPEIIQAIRTVYTPITIGWQDHFRFVLNVPDEFLLEPNFIDAGIGKGFLTSYYAYCSYLNHSKPSPIFVSWVENIIESNNTELDLTLCPGIEPGSHGSFDLNPVVRALQHNLWFQAVSLRNVKRKDILSAFATVFYDNSYCRALILPRVNADADGVVLLGSSLAQNSYIRLRDIDLSYNNIGDKGCSGLSSGLSVLPNGLRVLNLNYCGISPKGIVNLCESIAENNEMAGNLMGLYLSGNRIEEKGCQALAELFSSWNYLEPVLSELAISDANIDLESIVGAIRSFLLGLVRLDISKTKMSKQAFKYLEHMFGSETAISEIQLGYVKGSSTVEICGLLDLMFHNDGVDNAKAWIDNNAFTKSSVQLLSKAISDSDNINTLVMSDCSMKPDWLAAIVGTLNEGSKINHLGIGCNIKKASKAPSLIQNLLTLCLNSNLTVLDLHGNPATNLYIGEQLVPILECLAQNPPLRVLDITANRMGDSAVTALSQSLRTNTNLTTLLFDGNKTTLTGFLTFRNVFAKNSTVREVMIPKVDFSEICKPNMKDYARVKEKLDKFRSELEDWCRTNGYGKSDIKMSSYMLQHSEHYYKLPPGAAPFGALAKKARKSAVGLPKLQSGNSLRSKDLGASPPNSPKSKNRSNGSGHKSPRKSKGSSATSPRKSIGHRGGKPQRLGGGGSKSPTRGPRKPGKGRKLDTYASED